MLKKCLVAMLPTNKKADTGDFVIEKVNEELSQILRYGVVLHEPVNRAITNYHLYILSDEKINKGDLCVVNWGVNTSGEPLLEVALCNKIGAGGIHYFDSMSMCFGEHELKASKIIASTDVSLNLPSLPELFIQEYIGEYNEKRVIADVLVDFYYIEDTTKPYTDKGQPAIFIPKVDPKNNNIKLRVCLYDEVKDLSK